MKIVVTGVKGQLGNEFLRQLARSGCSLGELPSYYSNASVIGIDQDELDIRNPQAIHAFIMETKPDIVFHCAAMTQVDACEDHQEEAMRVNAEAVEHIAKACEQLRSKLVYFSTDYVFAGNRIDPYREDDTCEPISVYGRSKLLGEKNALQFCSRTFVIRTAWLYGLVGKNFVKTIRGKAQVSDDLKVVVDQIGCPTNAEDLVFCTLSLSRTEHYGVYHCTGQGSCSWWEFANAIIEFSGMSREVKPCKTGDYPAKAARPAYSILSNDKIASTIGYQMRPWKQALMDYIQKLQQHPKRVAVTGAGGYIGRYVVDALLRDGCEVAAVDIRPFDCNPNAEMIVADIFNEDVDIYEQLGKPDALIHLAWRDAFVHNSMNHLLYLPKHFNFLQTLLSRGLRRIGIMGTMHEIGYWEGMIGENTPCNPSSLYGISKNALRQSLSTLQQQFPNAVFQWLRAYYIFGDDVHSNSVFSKIIAADAEGKNEFPLTSGINKYDFINIKLLAAQIAAAIEQEAVTGIVECCTGQPVSLRDKIEDFLAETNLKIRIAYNTYPNRTYDSPAEWGNPEKINRILYGK